MSDTNIQKKKLFCAPSRKEVIKDVGERSKEKTSKPTVTKSEDKDSSSSNGQNCGSANVKKCKQKQKIKTIPKSLTDEEYSEIFQNVLDAALKGSDSAPQDACESSSPHEDKDKCSTSGEKVEDEFYSITKDLQVDQWNERSAENLQNNNKLTEKKEKEEKKNEAPHLTSLQEKEMKNKHLTTTGKQMQKIKTIPKSLTDEEYSEIFQNVLDAALNLDNAPLDSPEKTITSGNKNKDEFDILTSDMKVDQWNERSAEKHQITNEKKKKTEKKALRLVLPNRVDHSLVDDESVDVMDCDSNHDEEEESGTWIQCSSTKCGKWRYVADISEPTKVPEHWECSMNSDKDHNSCEASEIEYDESEHIMTKYTLGSVVWAKMDGFPWWPAMIDSDPDYDTYFELPTSTSMIPYMYHVTFFDEHVSRAWIRSHFIAPYYSKLQPKTTLSRKSQSNRKELKIAISNAEIVMHLPLQERLDQYSFLKRFSKWKKTKNTTCNKKRKGANKQKDLTAKNLLSSSNTMMEELDVAIANCKNSEDEDYEEESIDEYLPIPRSSRKKKQLVKDVDESSCCTDRNRKSEDQNIENLNKDSKNFVDDLTDSDESATDEKDCDTKTHNNCADGINFDPDIFTMELDKQDDKPEKDVDFDSCSKLREEKRMAVSDRSDGIISSVDEVSDMTVEQKHGLDDMSSNGKMMFDSSTPAEESELKQEVNEPKISYEKDDLKHSALESDSEKENKDPNEQKDKQHTFLSRKREKKMPSDNGPKKKKGGKDEQNEHSAEGLTEISKGGKQNGNSFVETRKEQKEQNDDSDSNGEMVKRSKTNNLPVKKNEVKSVNNDKKGNKQSTNKKPKLNRKDEQLIAKNGKVENNSIEPIHQMSNTDETKAKKCKPLSGVSILQKKVVVPKSFINPVRDMKVSKSSDRNVPTSSCDDKKELHRSSSQQDQSVPDVTHSVIDDNEGDVSDHDMKVKGKKENLKEKDKPIEKEEDSSDDEELNLSFDSLDIESSKENLMDVNDSSKNEIHAKGNKHEYGRFQGHCSDHDSNSDPFELIEE